MSPRIGFSAPVALERKMWYTLLQHLVKEGVRDSGHDPMSDEPQRFKALLRDRLLTLEKEGPTL